MDKVESAPDRTDHRRPSTASGSPTLTLLDPKDIVAIGKAADGSARAPTRADHVHHRPQRQLHERPSPTALLRLLPAAGDRAEGYLLPKTVIYKKARRRSRSAAQASHAVRHHLTSGSTTTRISSARSGRYRSTSTRCRPRDPAHRATLEADRPGHADAAAPVDSIGGAGVLSTASARSRRRGRKPRTGSASCGTRTGWACRRRRR